MSPTARHPPTSAWRLRARERALFGWVGAAVLLGYAMLLLVKLSNAPQLEPVDLIPAAVFLLSLAVVHMLLVAAGIKGDPLLLPAALFLAGIGVLMQWRLHSYRLENPGYLANYSFPAGVILMVLTALAFAGKRYRALRGVGLAALALSVALLAGILIAGHRFRGAVFLWGNVNPAEAVKVLLVVFLAGFLTPHQESFDRSFLGVAVPPAKVLWTLGILWSIPMGLLAAQRDLGMIVLLNAVLIIMLFALTGRWSYLFFGALLTAALCLAIFKFAPHSQRRLLAWYHPFADATGASWQILQGLSAMYSGGVWGSGLGMGSPRSIPIASSDFVYAAIGEELGYVGCGLVVAAYLVLFHRGLRIAYGTKDDFGRLLATGLTSGLAIQTLLNVAGVTKFAPLTGLTLPLVSYGGSSLITSFIALGLLLAISEDVPSKPPPRQPGR